MATPNPIVTVKQQWRTALAALMPNRLDGATDPVSGLPLKVPVFYSYPGDDLTGFEAVWMHGGSTSYDVTAMRAAQRRRLITCQFELIAQVVVEQQTEQDPAGDATDPQATADARAQALVAIADDHISTDEHMASASLVDIARTVGTRLEYGTSETGSWSRVTLTVEFDARIL